jgi:hypothetical protein
VILLKVIELIVTVAAAGLRCSDISRNPWKKAVFPYRPIFQNGEK